MFWRPPDNRLIFLCVDYSEKPVPWLHNRLYSHKCLWYKNQQRTSHDRCFRNLSMPAVYVCSVGLWLRQPALTNLLKHFPRLWYSAILFLTTNIDRLVGYQRDNDIDPRCLVVLRLSCSHHHATPLPSLPTTFFPLPLNSLLYPQINQRNIIDILQGSYKRIASSFTSLPRHETFTSNPALESSPLPATFLSLPPQSIAYIRSW